jgi:hypothetical protein
MTGTTPVLTIGDAGAEDTAIVFDGNAQDFYIALDDSADDLVIGLGSTVGTTPAISINEDRDVTISDGAIDFDVASHDGTNGLKLGGTLVTTTAAELNLLDGDTSVGSSITVADADGFVVNDGGTMKTIPATDITTYVGGGITAASQWRITADFSGDATPMINWEVGDTDGYGSIGSAMSESSGIFTFPSTGYWLITLFIKDQNDDDDPYANYSILSTTDDSSYGIAAHAQQGYSGGHYGNASCEFLFDVTDTTNYKIRFDASNRGANNTVNSGTSWNATYATFLRLGDT